MYRLGTQHEGLHGFRNRGEAEASKPRRPEGVVPNRLRKWFMSHHFYNGTCAK